MPEDGEECNSEDPIVRFIESYSCWHRLKKGLAWLFRCKNWLRARMEKQKGHLQCQLILWFRQSGRLRRQLLSDLFSASTSKKN